MFRGEYEQVRFQEHGFYLHNISASGYTQNAIETSYGLTSNGQGTDVNYHFIKNRFYGSQNPFESFGGNNDGEDRFLGAVLHAPCVGWGVDNKEDLKKLCERA